MRYLAIAASSVLWLVRMLLSGAAEMLHMAADGVQAAEDWLADRY